MRTLIVLSLLVTLYGCGSDDSMVQPNYQAAPSQTIVKACGVTFIEKNGQVYPTFGDAPIANGVYSMDWGINCSYQVSNGSVKEI